MTQRVKLSKLSNNFAILSLSDAIGYVVHGPQLAMLCDDIVDVQGMDDGIGSEIPYTSKETGATPPSV